MHDILDKHMLLRRAEPLIEDVHAHAHWDELGMDMSHGQACGWTEQASECIMMHVSQPVTAVAKYLR